MTKLIVRSFPAGAFQIEMLNEKKSLETTPDSYLYWSLWILSITTAPTPYGCILVLVISTEGDNQTNLPTQKMNIFFCRISLTLVC